MPQYSYSTDPLDSGSIRLLGLMPAKDLSSPIHCRLHDYSLRESDRGIHLYEALSYVWGSPENPKVVNINNCSLSVTANLYTALIHLRDCTFERIIWVDSICINQEDNTEKGQQIQLMAEIYGQANRVVVYLGDEANDSNQALESIRVAAEGESSEGESLDRGVNEMNQRGVLELLKRPWFERIWANSTQVLQEVGFAQQILIMCGSATIDGYTFSTGFSQLFYNRHSDLLDLIRPVMYLIRGAIFRPKHGIRSSGALSLGELLDMYHTRMATKLHDKVYALLSMSSDAPNLAGLLPDYKVTWTTLLKRLVKFTLSKDISVKAWEGKEVVLVESKGYILGHVLSIDIDSTGYERQCVQIDFNNHPESLYYYQEYKSRWIIQASAKSIRQGDLVCFLRGASKPSIIRTYEDYFAIIVIAVPLNEHTKRNSGSVESPHSLLSARRFTRDFLLIWNWKQSPKSLQGQAEYENKIESYPLVSEYLKADTNRVVNSINVALALGDTRNYIIAKDILQRRIKNYEEMLGQENLLILALKEALACIYYHQRRIMKAEAFLMQIVQIRSSLQGKDHPDTLSSIAKLGLVYMAGKNMEGRHEMTISNKIENNTQMSEEDMIQVGKSCDRKMMKLVLDLEKKNFEITENVLEAVAKNDSSGYEVMELLLAQEEFFFKVTENVVKAAAKNHDGGYEIVKLLIERRGEEITITTQIMNNAVGNLENGYQIVKFLLENGHEEITITEDTVKIALKNKSCGYDIVVMLLFEKRGKEITITEGLLIAVAENYRDGYEIMMLLLWKRGKEITITEELLTAVASNGYSGSKIMKLLFEKRGKEITITEEIMKAAAGNPSHGRDMIRLLLDKRGEEVTITDEVFKVAEGLSFLSEEAMELLLKRQATNVIIPEWMFQTATKDE
ncbi:hypothetical protein BGAL_0065g00380 [Botrytis galanthina]|uniref:Heterokaryon incompatibility domain-containing protein n=1 Tax=Botrytis galanthina TaxID=278940 RepID=A0A4S8REH9_9HELO|nr:hypothetical protein BGAL_0065g00380 [Botrytis galanthina]